MNDVKRFFRMYYKFATRRKLFLTFYVEDDNKKKSIITFFPNLKMFNMERDFKNFIKHLKASSLTKKSIKATCSSESKYILDFDTSRSISCSVIKILNNGLPPKFGKKLQSGRRYAFHIYGIYSLVLSLLDDDYTASIASALCLGRVTQSEAVGVYIDALIFKLEDVGVVAFTKLKTVGLVEIIKENCLIHNHNYEDIILRK